MEKITNIDFHAHILPGADHGCDSKDMCLKQLKQAKKNGIDIIVATPHFYPDTDTVEAFLKRRKEAYDEIRELEEKGLPKVLLGAEVLICNNMDRLEELEKLCIEGTRTILIEMPFAKRWDKRLTDAVRAIKEVRGLNVVLAHIDRYNKDEVRKLTDMGVKAQINATAMYKLRSMFKCRYYMKNCDVVALGSDIHRLSDNYKYLRRAVKKQAKSGNVIMKKTNAIIDGQV